MHLRRFSYGISAFVWLEVEIEPRLILEFEASQHAIAFAADNDTGRCEFQPGNLRTICPAQTRWATTERCLWTG